jgi:hypothetical protein
MTTKTRTAALAGFLCVSIAFTGIAGAFGQAVPTSSSIKTIGTPSAPAKPEIVPSLLVMNSRGASLLGDNLVLLASRRARLSSPIAQYELPVTRLPPT